MTRPKHYRLISTHLQNAYKPAILLLQIAPRAHLRIRRLQLILTLVVHSRRLEIPPALGTLI